MLATSLVSNGDTLLTLKGGNSKLRQHLMIDDSRHYLSQVQVSQTRNTISQYDNAQRTP